MSEFAIISAESDQIQLKLLESVAGITLERVIRLLDVPIPDGDAPYRFATIAASVSRRLGGPAGEVDATVVRPDPSAPDAARSNSGGDVGTSTELVVVRARSTALAVYDPIVGQRWRSSAAQWSSTVRRASTEPVPAADTDGESAVDERDEPPDFPQFRLTTTIAEWVSDNVFSEDVAEIATILGSSVARTYRRLRTAMTIIHGLPRFADRVRAGDFTIAHVEVVADLCHSVAFEHLPALDDHLAERRADVTSDRLRTALRKRISVLEPAEDRSKTAAERRRVDVQTFKNGSACLSMTGPADEINACYLRIEAMARAVRARNGGAFNLPPGVEIVDDRAFDNLMYDIATRPQPKLTIRVRQVDPVTGVQSESEEPLLDDEGNLLFDIGPDGAIVMKGRAGALQVGDRGGVGGAEVGVSAAAPGQVSAFWSGDRGRDAPRIIDFRVVASMPTHLWWLAAQAALITTVPVLTLLGESDLPGSLPDGSPIPAETARRIAGACSTVTRILTDPATGTPIDAKATTYRIPADVRRTLIAQWVFCTVPGCSRKAVKAEIDHVIPFFKLDPLKGGLTRFGNLHPLCSKHHAFKTAGRLRVRMSSSGTVEYDFKHGVTTRSRAPDQPIDVAHALEFSALCGHSPGGATIPDHLIPPAKDFVDVDPCEETIRERDERIRERDERIRRAEEAADRERRLTEKCERAREARRRLRLAQLLDWRNAVFPKCLPPGSDPVTMKRLLPGKSESGYVRRRRREKAGDDWVMPLNAFWSHPITWHRSFADDPPPF